MKEFLKAVLKVLKLYYPLQLFYRQGRFLLKKTFYRATYFKYKGTGLTCNFCRNSYDRFVPDYPAREDRDAIAKNSVIAGYGENILCPFCLSTARERLVKVVLEHSDLEGKLILHISPEKKIYDFLSPQANVITTELTPDFYKDIDKNIQQADVTNLLFPDQFFDLVIGNHILEHIPDDRKAMSEIYRVLKKDGMAVLQVPFSETKASTLEEPFITNPQRQSETFGQKDHVRIYSLSDYVYRLKEAGFAVNFVDYNSLAEYYKFAIQRGEGFFQIKK